MEDKGYSVLIVDDEEDLLDICVDSFEMEGFKTFSALNGALALDILKTETLDAVVSDSYMPEMSGQELLKEMMKLEGKKPLFYLSTGAIDADEKDLISKGATGLISKPFDIDEMIEKVKKEIDNR